MAVKPLLSTLVLLDKTNHQPAELRRLLYIHEVPHVLDHHTVRPRYSSFNRACMRMNVRDIGVSYEHCVGMAISRSLGNAGFSESSKYARVKSCGFAESISIMRFLAASLPGAIKYLSWDAAAIAPCTSPFSSGLPKALPRSRKMLRVRHAAHHCAHKHKLLHDLRMFESEINRYLAAVGTSDDRSAARFQMTQ
jgi:hypothetical protein